MSKGTILVVEDDMALLEGLKDILELDGYAVTIAGNGLEGLERLREAPTPPDLIVSDIMMPRMNGYEFFEAVRSEPEWMTLPFIFLTAKGEKTDIRVGKGLGVDDYVTKPFDSEDVLVAVESRLKRAKQLDAVQTDQISGLKRNVLTILNHEFRTPLTYVVAYADMLSRDVEDLDDAEFHSFLRGIQAGSERLRRLIENFIFLVELETDEAQQTYEWRKATFDEYRELFETVINEYIEAAETNHITFAIDVSEEVPPIEADEEYLRRALGQLIENAVKFSDPEGGTVTLAARAVDNMVELAVSDEGRGIAPAEMDQIFEPFYQIDRDHYEDQGAGSGLAIVRGIAKMHGGEVRVESAFGEGSTFIVALPIQNA